jgi:hypothetical protein
MAELHTQIPTQLRSMKCDMGCALWSTQPQCLLHYFMRLPMSHLCGVTTTQVSSGVKRKPGWAESHVTYQISMSV